MSRNIRKFILAFALALAVGSGAAPAMADEHDPQDAGHPLRMAGYIVHPFGVIIDVLILRPAHWLVEREPMRTLFGHTEY